MSKSKSPRPLPTYGLRAAPRAFERMGAELSALHARVRRSQRWYGLLSLGAALVVFAATFVIASHGGPLVGGGVLLLFAIGVGVVWMALLRALFILRKTPGRYASFGCLSILFLLIPPALVVASAVLAARSPTVLGLFDLRGDPSSLVTIVALATFGLLSGLLLLRWQVSPSVGPLNEYAVAYVSELVVPLVRDAAVGSQPSADVCIQEPKKIDWVTVKEGVNRRGTFVRELASVHVPLEVGEHVHVRVREEFHLLWRVKASASGRIKTKQRGSDRRAVAEISWRMRVSPPDAQDLSAALQEHLAGKGLLRSNVNVRADSRGHELRARLSLRDRDRRRRYEAMTRWIDPKMVLAAVHFLSTQRARVSVR